MIPVVRFICLIWHEVINYHFVMSGLLFLIPSPVWEDFLLASTNNLFL